MHLSCRHGVFVGSWMYWCWHPCPPVPASICDAKSNWLCMGHLQIRWRSTAITSDFTRLWCGLPESPPGWFNTPPSECPINTSVLPSKSKGIRGRLQQTGPVRWEEEESSPPFTPKCCVVVHMLWRNANQFRHRKIKERSTMTCRVSGNISCCTSMCGSWIKKKNTHIFP